MDPDPGWVKKQDPDPLSYFRELRNNFLGLKYFNSFMRIRDGKNSDPGWKNSDPGIITPDPQHWLSFLILKVKIRKRTEPVFVNVYGAQESIPPILESIPGLLERLTKTGSGREASPLEGLLVRGLWLNPGDVHHLVQDVQHRAEHCAPRREESRNNQCEARSQMCVVSRL
jgi:hypothetical protein